MATSTFNRKNFVFFPFVHLIDGPFFSSKHFGLFLFFEHHFHLNCPTILAYYYYTMSSIELTKQFASWRKTPNENWNNGIFHVNESSLNGDITTEQLQLTLIFFPFFGESFLALIQHIVDYLFVILHNGWCLAGSQIRIFFFWWKVNRFQLNNKKNELFSILFCLEQWIRELYFRFSLCWGVIKMIFG